MGNFYTNYTLRGPTQQAVASALAGRAALVSPSRNGCVVAFDAATEQDIDAAGNLAKDLSHRLQCAVLAVSNHDDDILWYRLYDRGQLLDEYEPRLQLVNADFDRSWIEQLWVFKERAAQPIIGLNYSEKIPAHQTPVPGLYLANTAQIYPEDRGTNYSVDLGNRIASMVEDDLNAGR